MKIGRAGPDGSPVVLVDVYQTAPRRHVAAVVGSPLWSAGPSAFYALGALLAAFGPRFGVVVLPPADVEPFVRVTRGDGRLYARASNFSKSQTDETSLTAHAHVVDGPGYGGDDLHGLRPDAGASGAGLPGPGESAGPERAST